MPNRPPFTIGRRRWFKPGLGATVNWSHPLARSMTHLYLFNEPGRTVFNTVKPSDGGGALNAAVTRIGTPVGVGLVFDNTAGHGVTLTKGLVVTSAAFTAEFYMRPKSFPTSGFFQSIWTGTGLSNGLGLGSGPNLAFDTDTDGQIDAGITLVANQWYHCIMTCTAAGSGTIYVNGVASSSNPLANTGTQTNPLTFIGGDSSAGFDGTIGWVRGWAGRVLTQSEALQLYLDPFAMLYEAAGNRRTISYLANITSGSNAIAGEADGTGTGTTLATLNDPRIAGESDGTGAATALTINSPRIAGEADGTGTGTALTINSPRIAGESDGVSGLTTLTINANRMVMESDGVSSPTTLTIRANQIAGQASGVSDPTTLTLTVGNPGVAIQGKASGVGQAFLTYSNVIQGESDGTGAATALTLTVQKLITAKASGSGVLTTLTLTAVIIIGYVILSDSLDASVILRDTSPTVKLADAPAATVTINDQPG